MGYGSLAATGVGLSVAGASLGWGWLAFAGGIVAAGATLVRFGFRRSESQEMS
jgi:hypothetical protein